MQIETIEIEQLNHDEDNVRVHDERNISVIARSLSEFGQQKPIVVDGDGVVVAGNGTLEAARNLGWTHIDCVRTELTGEAARAFAIADNRTAELAAWDNELLKNALDSLHTIDPADLGFNADEVNRLVQEWSGNDDLLNAEQYDPDTHEKYTLKIVDIAHDDKDRVKEVVQDALNTAGLTYECNVN